MGEAAEKIVESTRDSHRELWRPPLTSNYRGGGGRVWTQADHAELARLHAEGRTFSEIGEALNRSRGNCVKHAKLLNLPARDRGLQCRRGFENYALRLLEVGGEQHV